MRLWTTTKKNKSPYACPPSCITRLRRGRRTTSVRWTDKSNICFRNAYGSVRRMGSTFRTNSTYHPNWILSKIIIPFLFLERNYFFLYKILLTFIVNLSIIICVNIKYFLQAYRSDHNEAVLKENPFHRCNFSKPLYLCGFAGFLGAEVRISFSQFSRNFTI